MALAAVDLDAASQTVAAAVPPKEAPVLAHLDAAVAWYHQAQAVDAWVMPPDLEFYRNNQHDLTNQAVTNAFAYAQGMVVLIGSEEKPSDKAAAGDARQHRLATRVSQNTERLEDLHAQQSAINAKLSAASYIDRPLLVAQAQLIQSQIDLDTALGQSLEKAMALVSGSGASGDGGSLSARIEALQKAVPDVFDSRDGAQSKKAAPTASGANSDGLVNRAVTLFSLLRYRHSIDALVSKTTLLLSAADALAEPLTLQLRQAIATGDDPSVQVDQTADITQLKQMRDKVDAVTERFQGLSAALIPLRQESMALEHTRANLAEWKVALGAQTDAILRILFTRAVGLIIVLAILFGISEGWRRATFKYVHDARRRRQFLLIRRFSTSILMIVVIVMGFVSDFSSLATFAGFITAGIAVALQTVILSVAAYFFLIGRYGVKVGDRVTVSGVTGDVIDIGLVRVFLMELAGTGVDLHPTGRVVVLANSALFSATPLYKQLPGTDYAWHEMFVTMSGDADAEPTEEALLKAVNTVYGGYRTSIERQHGALERLLDYKTDLPVPSAHIRLCDTGLEVVIRYPAEISKMSAIDEAVSKEVLATIRSDEALKKGLTSMPRIRSAVKS